jgi:hypothetical protein
LSCYIFYFTEHFVFDHIGSEAVKAQLRQQLGSKFDGWFADIQSLLLQDGVEYIGAVSHQELTTSFAEAGFM